MKTSFLLLFSLLFFNSSPSIDAVREAYKAAASNKNMVDNLYQLTSSISNQDKPELIVYKGAAIALKAKYAKTIKAKKEGFITGVTIVNKTIENNPNNIEARFVRLTIQENTPKFLGYKNNLEDDKNFIVKQFAYIKSNTLKKYLKEYISQSKVFTNEEKKLILNL